MEKDATIEGFGVAMLFGVDIFKPVNGAATEYPVAYSWLAGERAMARSL